MKIIYPPILFDEENEFEEDEKYWKELYKSPDIFCCDWNDSQEEILEEIDRLLIPYNLEIVEYKGHGNSFTTFKIEQRKI